MRSALEFTQFDEVEQHRHPILPDSQHYRLIRARYDIRYDGSESSVVLDLQHKDTGGTRRLRFDGASISRTLEQPYGLYILDIRYRGWELGVEVGEYFEEGGVYFHARSVRGISAEPSELERFDRARNEAIKLLPLLDHEGKAQSAENHFATGVSGPCSQKRG